MKKFALLLFMIISTTTFSQEGRPPRGEKPDGEPHGKMPKKEKISVDEQVKKMTLDLNLNEIQQLQVREVFVDLDKKRDDYAPKKDLSQRPNKEEMEVKKQEEKKVIDEKFRKILTVEQFTKWSERKTNSETKKKKSKKEKTQKSEN